MPMPVRYSEARLNLGNPMKLGGKRGHPLNGMQLEGMPSALPACAETLKWRKASGDCTTKARHLPTASHGKPWTPFYSEDKYTHPLHQAPGEVKALCSDFRAVEVNEAQAVVAFRTGWVLLSCRLVELEDGLPRWPKASSREAASWKYL